MPIDPHTGRFTPGEPEGILGGINLRVARERDLLLRNRAADIVSELREFQTGEIDPRLEARRRAALDVLGGEAEGPGFFERQGASTIEGRGAGSVFGLEGARPTIRSPEDALGQLSILLQPGSAEFTEFANQVTEIRKEAQFRKLAPTLSQVTGIPQEALSPDTVSAAIAAEKAFGPNFQLRLKPVLGPGGAPSSQLVAIDPNTGDERVLSDIVPRSQSGTITTVDEEGNVQIISGTDAFVEKARATTRGREEEERLQASRRGRVQLKTLGQALERADELISTGQEPLGAVGEFTAGLRSTMEGLARGANIAGFKNVGSFIRRFDSPALSQAAQKNAALASTERTLALLRLFAERPGEKDFSSRDVDRALEANRGISSGDPQQAAAVIRELYSGLVQAFNNEAADLGEPLFDARDAAPRLFKPTRQPTLVPGEAVRGRGLTVSERAELRRLIKEGNMSADEARELIRRKKMGQ